MTSFHLDASDPASIQNAVVVLASALDASVVQTGLLLGLVIGLMEGKPLSAAPDVIRRLAAVAKEHGVNPILLEALADGIEAGRAPPSDDGSRVVPILRRVA